MTIAPPTPPTTPPITFFEAELRPESPPSPPLPFKLGEDVTTAWPVVTASRTSVVTPDVMVDPSLVSVRVDVTLREEDVTSAEVKVVLEV